MKVALLPTGRTEWYGLPEALQRLYPGHEFYALPDETGFRSTGPFGGFTSNPLSQRNEDDAEYLPENATDLVGRAAQEALGDGPHREAADAVMVLDDLELANRHQPDRVTRVFRKAVERHLVGLQGSRTRTAKALKQRVSFHLVVPMIEAWLFGDPAALVTAGVPAGVSPMVDSDLESYRTSDPAYLAAAETDCPCWIETERPRKHRPKWLVPGREHHPKGYLQWLCIDGRLKNCTTYSESDSGARALAALDWSGLLARPIEQVRYLRAFLADLAEALNEPPVVEAKPAPATSLHARPSANVLRNL